MNERAKVVTYQHAYLSGRTISLCADHGRLEHAPGFGSLGPVEHGSHVGVCVLCSQILRTYDAQEYEDHDDPLAAAVADARHELSCDEWEIEARWEDDRARDRIEIVTTSRKGKSK